MTSAIFAIIHLRYTQELLFYISTVTPPLVPSILEILEILEAFLKQTELVTELSGKLAIIEPGRIRIRKS